MTSDSRSRKLIHLLPGSLSGDICPWNPKPLCRDPETKWRKISSYSTVGPAACYCSSAPCLTVTKHPAEPFPNLTAQKPWEIISDYCYFNPWNFGDDLLLSNIDLEHRSRFLYNVSSNIAKLSDSNTLSADSLAFKKHISYSISSVKMRVLTFSFRPLYILFIFLALLR